MNDVEPSTETYDVFISYSSLDQEYAEPLCEKLRAAGFSVWLDKIRLTPGFNWHQGIEAGCNASRVLLPVLTPNWKTSTWTCYETYGAEQTLPLHVAGELDDVLTPPLSRMQIFPFDPKTAGPDDWETLFQAIRKLLVEPRPDKRERTAHLRYRPNPHFVGREEDLLKIHEALYRTPTAALTQGQSVSVHAMGGVGKTTLAREYAEHYWRCYQQILWVDANIGLDSEFARLAEIFNPELKQVKDAVAKADYALQVLNQSTERLLILDNVEDEASVQDWIPKAGGCHTLITSRFAHWSAAIATLHVYVLEPAPARELLLRRSAREASQTDLDSVDLLAKKLGFLPLALEQAAAFIKEEGAEYTFADYLALYETATGELLSAGVLGSTEYPDSVMTTWHATMQRLEENHLARVILRLSSFYSTEPIPNSLFAESFELLHKITEALHSSEKTETVPTCENAELAIRQALKDLDRYSLINRQGHSFTLHALVQTVQRLDIPQPEYLLWLEASLHIVNNSTPFNPTDVRTWPVLEPLVPHIAEIIEYADASQIDEPTTRLMNQYGLFLETKGLFQAAEPLMRRALQIDEAAYGPEHPDVATALSSLAQLLQATNRLTEAEPLMRRALQIDEAAYEPEHPTVARDLNNLAQLLQATNRLVEAEPLMRRVLQIDEAAYGPEHPEVATALNNLANLLKATNRLAEAEPLMRRALQIAEAAYGPEHPTVAIALNNLAGLLFTTNRLTEAEPLMQRALQIDEAAYGPEHPTVARNLNNLAQLLQATNRLTEAEPLMQWVVSIYESAFGENHPDVATALNNLAGLLFATNRLAEAEPRMRRALQIDEAAYGPEHPTVARNLSNLAQLLQATNRLTEAEPLMRRALQIAEAAYGPEHPDVATALSSLAGLLFVTNRLTEAEPLMRRTLEINEAAYGPEHPDVAASLNNLAQLLKATNRLAEAEPLMRRVLEIFIDFNRQMGHEHPHSQTAVNNYTRLLSQMGFNEQEIQQRLTEIGINSTDEVEQQRAHHMSQRLAFLIGVTGHRDLGEEHPTALKSAVRKIFTDLHEQYPQTSFLLLSPLAEGADRLVAEVALELAADDSFQATIELVVPLPWPRAVCEDLLHRTGKRSEFDALLNQATQIIEMPLVEGVAAEEIVNSEESRAKQYREVGRFIARHSQMLIALWDGVQEPEGGTARVIRWQQEGTDAPFIKTQNSLDEPECGPVYHIAVPREQSDPDMQAGERNTLYPKHGRDKDKVESYFHNMWSSINDFNRDISVETASFQSRVSQSKDWILPEQHQAQLYEQHQRLLSLYAASDAAALDNQKKKNRTIGGLFFLVGVAVVCFELYTHLLINWWELLIAYIVLLSAGVGLHRYVTRQKFHDKFIDYRSLAEALRVQFFWRLAGLPLTVSDHYLRTVRSELDWIRQAVRSSQLLTQAHSSLEQELVQQNQKHNFNLVQKYWVEDQLNYYERSAQKNKETAHRWEWWITFCFRTAISLAVVMLLIHLKTEKMNHILAVLVFIAAAGAAFAHEFSEKAAFSVLARRYKWMHSLFATAHKRLAENVESCQYDAAQEIVQLLGEDALIENADWVIQTRHRQPELPAPG